MIKELCGLRCDCVMKVALIGYGKMGHIIEKIAIERGHEVVCIIDKDNLQDFESERFMSAQVAIEFTTPGTAVANIRRAWRAGVPVVCGTTGWKDKLAELQAEARDKGYGLFWTSNFSVGVNLFFALNKYLSELMSAYNYEVGMTEVHHVHKLDAPSGTAVTLAEDISFPIDRIESVRKGEVPGTHIVSYDSEVDRISISHEAKSREGFALGAVLAAEYMRGRRGFYDMKDLLKIK